MKIEVSMNTVMKAVIKISSALIVVALFSISSVAMADAGKGHGLSKDKNPHAEGGCASKGKIAQFHKFHPKKGMQVKVPNSQNHSPAQKTENLTTKVPSLDQFI